MTLDAIAAAARTTRQTIIRLYGSRAGLIAAAVEQWPAELQERFYPKEQLTPRNLVESLCSIYESVGERTLDFLAMLPSHPELLPLIAGGRERHRAAIDQLLATLVTDMDATSKDRLREEMLVITDLHVWDLLRRERAIPAADVVDLMVHMLTALIKAAIRST